MTPTANKCRLIGMNDIGIAITPLKRIQALGIKTTWLAEQLGLSQSYTHDLLTGKRGAEKLREYAPRIAELCRVDVDWLFPGLAEQPEEAADA